MSKIVARIFTILLLPIILIGGINFWIDPDYTLKNNYIPSLVQSLIEGKMIAGPANINVRILKKKWIEQLPHTPNVLVLGSSRTLSLPKEAFSGQTYFNASVTNCTFQDMYAFLNFIEKKGENLPETVVICADQWLFASSFNEKRWLENRSEAIEMIQKAGIISQKGFPSKWNIQKEWIKELFSVRYVMRSLKTWGKVEKFEICQTVERDKMMLMPDGSRSVPGQVIDEPEAQIAEVARNYFYASKDEYFTELDAFQCNLFEGLVKYLENHHSKVILFIPPFHPVTERMLAQSKTTSGILVAQNYLQAFAQKQGLIILGGTNPEPLNLRSMDFYDAIHLKPASLSRLFQHQTAKLEERH